MDEKTHEKETEKFASATKDFRAARVKADKETHSENKTWEYDHKTGQLVRRKK